MLKKLLLIVVVFAFASNFAFSGPKVTPEQLSKLVRLVSKSYIVGDVVYYGSGSTFGVHLPQPYKNITSKSKFESTGWISSVTFVQTGAKSEYDLISNGSPDIIVQNQTTWDNIHAVCMSAPLGDPSTFPNRRTKYMYSADRGTTWTFESNVPDARSGFATITLLADNRELVSNHSDPNSTGNVSLRCYVDAYEGLGSFTTLDPGDIVHEWPRIVSTSSITNTNKFLVVGSRQSDDTCWWASGLSLTSSSFSSWNIIPADPAERYKLARGTDGRIGFVYIGDYSVDPATDGNLYFMESTNNGTSFSTPTKIWNCDMTGDSLAAMTGVSITYQGTVPKIVFSTQLYEGSGYYYPNSRKARIKFWSTNLPGSDPNRCITIVDTQTVGYHPAIYVTSSDGFMPICAPSIGISNDVLFVAFQTPYGNADGESFVFATSSDTNSYNSVWLTASGNNGLSWKKSIRITPTDSSVNMKDYTFPSMCPANDYTTSSYYYANFMMYKDSLAGTYVRHTSNPQTEGEYIFTRVAVPSPVFVNNISTVIPDKYSLYQNYPNPFNPTTNIRFALPKSSNITLKVYNINGQLIETLIKNEVVSAGTNEVKFNATSLASGIYFYTIETGSFKETKKMMLIK
jgi:hypothetical protein